MILEFMTTNKNTYGHRKYLAIDFEKGLFSVNPTKMIVSGIEIKSKDYKALIEKITKKGFREIENIFTNELFSSLHSLFFSLNNDLLQDLERHCKEECENNGIHVYDLLSLIEKYSWKYPKGLSVESIEELKHNNSISCMNDYYELIELMISDIDI